MLPHWSYNVRMATTTVSEIQQDFLGVLHRVEQGETILVLQDNRPVAELRPIATLTNEPRPYGLLCRPVRGP